MSPLEEIDYCCSKGLDLLRSGRVDEIRHYLYRSATLLLSAGRNEAEHTEYRRRLGRHYLLLGDFYQRQNNLSQAAWAYKEALNIFTRNVNDEPDNSVCRLNLKEIQSRSIPGFNE